MTILSRYIAGLYLRFVLMAGAAVLCMFQVIDFADRMSVFAHGRALDILELYWNKGIVAAHQVGPAVVLLAAGAAVSTLRQRGELTALRSLSFGTFSIYVPIGLCALLLCGALVALDEWAVTRAGERIDFLHRERFNAWGDWTVFHAPKRWFRVGGQILHVRAGDSKEGFGDVTLLRLDEGFRLASRIDAARLEPLGGTRWQLSGGVQRTFGGDGGLAVRSFEREVVDLGVDSSHLRIRTGRPEQMRVGELQEQIALRDELGLPTQRFRFMLHHRFAYPLTGVPAGLLAIGLALRPGRRGHLTMALIEALAVAVLFWGLLVMGKALALSDRLSAGVAAWTPLLLLVALSAAVWLRREGRLGAQGS